MKFKVKASNVSRSKLSEMASAGTNLVLTHSQSVRQSKGYQSVECFASAQISIPAEKAHLAKQAFVGLEEIVEQELAEKVKGQNEALSQLADQNA